jgi:hypothetical protein
VISPYADKEIETHEPVKGNPGFVLDFSNSMGRSLPHPASLGFLGSSIKAQAYTGPSLITASLDAEALARSRLSRLS